MSQTPLTPYDTGVRLEPKPWHVQRLNLPDEEEADRFGRVDFDNDEGAVGLTVYVEYDKLSEESTLHIENVADPDKLQVTSDGDGPLIVAPTRELQDRVEETIADLDTSVERESAEVYWNRHQALIIVPGEQHVRKQQVIHVSDNADTMSALVQDWAGGVHGTGIE